MCRVRSYSVIERRQKRDFEVLCVLNSFKYLSCETTEITADVLTVEDK